MPKNYELYDPYGYEQNHSDRIRCEKIQSHLPARHYQSSLDIGCGNGFVTSTLPGDKVLGVDPCGDSIDAARKRCSSARFSFFQDTVYNILPQNYGRFDLIVITGVLYPHIVGNAYSLILKLVDDLLLENGILIVTNITDHLSMSFDYYPIAVEVYLYRNTTHRLDVYQKRT